MNVETQKKRAAGMFIFFLFFIIVALAWFPVQFELVIAGSLLIFLVLVIMLPKWLILFLCNLICEPSNGRKREAWDRGWRIVLMELVQAIHDGFWGFVTRYYPFSLLYADRLFHARNQDIKSFIKELEAYAKKVHLPFLIQSGDVSSPMMMFRVIQTGKRLRKADYLEQLKEKLQEKYESIYLQDKADGFTILVPTSMVRG